MSTPKVVIPESGVDRKELIEEMKKIREQDAHWKEGKTTGLVYYAGEEHNDFLLETYGLFFEENGLNPVAFPSLKKFEAEVVSMTASFLGGNHSVTGAMTTCGTESILTAIKTYREWARKKKPQIKEPEMIVPASVHPAFNKAAHYFDVKIVIVPLRDDFRADPEAMKAAINDNTILMVGSAPCYPYGLVDPIEEIAAIAKENDLGMHVDCCLGGFLMPFVRNAGYPVPNFDFSVDGVTSISADCHKYGYAAKGASVVLYKNSHLRRHQFFIYADWCGGIYASPGMMGSRPGGGIAAAWASIMAHGMDGYTDNARRMMKTALEIKKGIEGIEELYIVGEPDATVMAIASDTVDMFAVGDVMEQKFGWHMDRQSNPNACHLMVTLAHEKSGGLYVENMKAAVEEVKAHPELSSAGSAAMYGTMARVPDKGMVNEFVFEFMDSLYSI